MRPSTTIKYVAEVTRSRVSLEQIKICAEIAGIVVLVLTLGCYVWLALLQKQANSIYQHSADLTQQSIFLTQKSLDLTRQSVQVAQEGLIPWIGITIKDMVPIERSGEDPVLISRCWCVNGKKFDNSVQVDYSLHNLSDFPSPSIYTSCFLDKYGGYEPRETATSYLNRTAILPTRSIDITANLLLQGGQPKAVIKLIRQGKVGIIIFLAYRDAIQRETSCLMTFYDTNGKFTITNTEFNPSHSEISKLIKDAMDPEGNDAKNKLDVDDAEPQTDL
jgi:hypothetical protein